MGLIPTNYENKIFLRENVEQNVRCMPKFQKKEMMRKVVKVAKSPRRHAHKRFDFQIKLTSSEGELVYGSIIQPDYIVILFLTKDSLTILSVVLIARLRATTKKIGCELVNDFHISDTEITHIFSVIDHNKSIIWRIERMHRSTNDRIHIEGFEMIPDVIRRTYH